MNYIIIKFIIKYYIKDKKYRKRKQLNYQEKKLTSWYKESKW